MSIRCREGLTGDDFAPPDATLDPLVIVRHGAPCC